MGIKLFLDDTRVPPDDTWTVARTADQAIELLKSEVIDEASLDHDLGHCQNCEGCEGYKSPCACRCHLTGYFVVCWMETEGVWPRKKPRVHSANPAGAVKMRLAIDRHYDSICSCCGENPVDVNLRDLCATCALIS